MSKSTPTLGAISARIRTLQTQAQELRLSLESIEAEARRETMQIDTLGTIMDIVSASRGIKLPDLRGRLRDDKTAVARMMCYYLARGLTNWSFPDLGYFFDRDHSSVVHGYSVIRARIDKSAPFKRMMDGLRKEIIGVVESGKPSEAAKELLAALQPEQAAA